MKKDIQLYNRKIEYTLKTSRRVHRMRLAVYCDGNFVVTVPSNFQQNLVEKFITLKSQWVLGKLEHFKKLREQTLPVNYKLEYLNKKRDALEFAVSRIKYFNAIYGFKYNKINIKDQKTRWGSCSRMGNLNFNYRIAMLPEKLADYIIVHELCHLEQFNHSPKFWNLVSQTVPDYLDRRQELRQNQALFK